MLARTTIMVSYTNTIQVYDKRVVTLNGTLGKLDEALNRIDNVLDHRDTHRFNEHRKKTIKNISKITSLKRNTTTCKEISKDIINGSDKVYAYKINPNSSIVSTLVNHPTVSNLICKEVDKDVIQQEYIDMINEISTKYDDQINPTEWIFWKKASRTNQSTSGTAMLTHTPNVSNIQYHLKKKILFPLLGTKM